MTNFYRITNQQNRSIICIGTNHSEPFKLFPQNWLNQLGKLTSMNIFCEQIPPTECSVKEETESFTSKSDESIFATLTNIDSQNYLDNTSSQESSFNKIDKFEQMFIALLYIVSTEDSNSEKCINAKLDIEKMKSTYLEYVNLHSNECQPKETEDQPEQILFNSRNLDLDFLPLNSTLQDSLLKCSILFRDEDSLKTIAMSAFQYLLSQGCDNQNIDDILISYVKLYIPFSQVIELEDYDQIQDIVKDDIASNSLLDDIAKYTHDAIASGIVQSNKNPCKFVCMEWNALEMAKVQKMKVSHISRNEAWFKKLICYLENNTSNILLIVGDHHMVAEYGIMSKILSLQAWSNSTVKIYDPYGLEYEFDPVLGEIIGYSEGSIESDITCSVDNLEETKSLIGED